MSTRNNIFKSIAIIIALATVFITASGFKEAAQTGEQLYKQHCVRCHGTDGTKGMLGARNLQKSTLPDAAIQAQIQNGKGFMPSFRKKITGDQLDAVMNYVKQLRKK